MRVSTLLRRRKGNILVLSAFLMIVMFAFLAFSVDLGYLQVAKTELQRTADAAAIAATWELIDRSTGTPTPQSTLTASAATKARDYATRNPVTRVNLQLADADIKAGVLTNPSDPSPAAGFVADATSGFNAVTVRVRQMDGTSNSSVPLFFARIWGKSSQSCSAQATAAFLNNFSGFQAPSDGSNLNILPFALDLLTWQNLMNGHVTDDNWTSTWDAVQKKSVITPGGDGVKEVNLFPSGTTTLPPGNRGTVDIGSNNNSTADIARQIVHGVSPADMAQMGGKLEFNADGKLFLNGDTGISAGVKDELASVIGQPRMIPLFSTVSGPGNNATYTIVGFAGVRILDVKLTSMNKRVIIQPAVVEGKGGIPSTGAKVTSYIYSPVWLVPNRPIN